MRCPSCYSHQINRIKLARYSVNKQGIYDVYRMKIVGFNIYMTRFLKLTSAQVGESIIQSIAVISWKNCLKQTLEKEGQHENESLIVSCGRRLVDTGSCCGMSCRC